MQLLEAAATDRLLLTTTKSTDSHDQDPTDGDAIPLIEPERADDTQVGTSSHVNQDETQKKFRCVQALLEREYWERRWIVQEVAVSRKVLFCYGRQTLDLDSAERALKPYQADIWWWFPETTSWYPETTPLGKLRRTVAFQSIKLILDVREQFHSASKPTLCNTIIQTRGFRSSRLHDQVFAVLGFCADGPELVPIPSYSQTIESLLTSLTRQMIRRQMCLDLILVDDRDRNLQSLLPSWVPDFLSPSVTLFLYTAAMKRKNRTHSFITESLQHDSHEPVVQGAVLGIVAGCTSTLGLQEDLEEDAQRQPDFNTDCDQTGRDYYGHRSKAVTDAIVQSLLMELLTWDLLEAPANVLARSQTDEMTAGLIYYLRRHERQDGKGMPGVAKWQAWLRKNEAFEVHGVQLASRFTLEVSMLSAYIHIHAPITVRILSVILPAALASVTIPLLPQELPYRRMEWAIPLTGFGLAVWRLFAIMTACVYSCYGKERVLSGNTTVKEEPRRLAICTNGLIAATCPGATVGDQICFVAGCKTAVVLGPIDLPGEIQARYRLIGKARAELSNRD